MRLEGLWHNREFLKLWAGQSISLLGSQVTTLALPLTAVLVLKASPTQMGILGAVQLAPFLILSLLVGVWVDQLPRRSILLWADVGRFVLFGSIPVSSIFHFLSIEYLYVVGLLTGILSVFFEVASQAYLPDLVETRALTEGNTKFEISRSLAQIAGPGLAGLLVQLISAPLAIVVDAVSFGISALFVGFIRPGSPPRRREKPALVFAQIWQGITQLMGNQYTRALIICGTTRSFFQSAMGAVSTLFFVRALNLTPLQIGLITLAGGIGTLIGAIFAARIARRVGLGTALIGGAALVGLSSLLIPAASGPLWLALVILTVSLFVSSLAAPIYGVNQLSLRQTITPADLQGRVNATVRFMAWGALSLGSLAGGFLGDMLGLRLTLLLGAVGTLLSFLWILFSPVRTLKDQAGAVTEEEVDRALTRP